MQKDPKYLTVFVGLKVILVDSLVKDLGCQVPLGSHFTIVGKIEGVVAVPAMIFRMFYHFFVFGRGAFV